MWDQVGSGCPLASRKTQLHNDYRRTVSVEPAESGLQENVQYLFRCRFFSIHRQGTDLVGGGTEEGPEVKNSSTTFLGMRIGSHNNEIKGINSISGDFVETTAKQFN